MAANRYTVSYGNKPAGQQVAAATLFFATSDANASTLYAAIVAAMNVDNTKALNSSIAGDYAAPTVVAPTFEMRANLTNPAGELGYIHVPGCDPSLTTESSLQALVTASQILDANAVAFTKIVRYEVVNQT